MPPTLDHPVIAPPLKLAVRQTWWPILLRGVAAILFGVMTFTWPGISLFVLVVAYAAYAIFDGVMCLIGALRGGARRSTWWLGGAGLVNILAGAAALLWPDVTTVAIVILIGIWAIVRGVLEIIGAVSLRRVIHNEWLLATAGVLSIVLGIGMILIPGLGALAILGAIGAYALVFGFALVALGIRLRAIAN